MKLPDRSALYSAAIQSILPLFLATSLCAGNALAQDSEPVSPQANQPAETPKPPAPDKPPADAAPKTPAQLLQQCWQTLTDNVQNGKQLEYKTQALDALSSLGTNARANGLIAAAMKDSNLDLRSAAVLAAGKTKSRALVAPVKALLNDPEPQVVFIAATTLWKQFHDRSGQDILEAIVAGDRKANPSLINGAKHDMSRTMHSRSALEKIGLETGATLALGPFGFSVAAVEYARKNGADSARVQSVDLLAEERTEAVHEDMKSAIDDKDPGVRAAALKALGEFHRSADAKAIEPLFDDSKLPVRLAASAAYINSLSGVARAKTTHP
jgi:HEAT repeat protein